MKIHYQDEYFSDLFVHTSDVVPRKGEMVAIGEIDYLVKSVVYHPDEEYTEIILAETLAREEEAPKQDGRLNEMQAAIFAIQRGQEELHKKHRSLRDQVSTVRTHVNQQIHKERKPS